MHIESYIKLSTMSSTTPSPMPKTIAIWFFFSFASSAIPPSPGFFVARTGSQSRVDEMGDVVTKVESEIKERNPKIFDPKLLVITS
ncbi:uncharacterized protein N7479_007630 [Penicillium vulpinum]|uniref:uncharacterized protein n=1 Tax=Penicillium vulpinum TaxID=29845 RepID=UPI002547CC7D|nr:uncharacterized protein N7479_007630 [Penicillium vulpinum]KAJ5960480.1 hypothetical protein N7479_007630 [Penicillium vulpinum]